MNRTRALVFGLACLLSASAMAQWQWIDKDGHKVFSDRAPPADIPDQNILQRPTMVAPAAVAPVGAEPGNAAVPAPKIGGQDKALEQKKKQVEEAAAAKKKAEEEKIARAQADNCARARQSMLQLQSGVRIATMNDKGERVFMDDAARAAETQRVQGIIGSDCH
ncbi:MAG: Putative transmembrane protein [Burkholderiaceae bacterium]|nr:MAG: Putative transmembrane protein [Burkholderiaceae bacterium]